MFGRLKYLISPVVRLVENRGVHENVHVRRIAYFDENSRSTLYKNEYYTRKSNESFTPQSGLATKELDLAYCFATNTNVDHSPVLISAIDKTNPQSGQAYVQNLVKDFNETFKDDSKFVDNDNNSKK